MANNRIKLICELCKNNGAEKYSLVIAKYYPSTGRFRPRAVGGPEPGMDRLIDRFFEAHDHYATRGQYNDAISIVMELEKAEV